MTFASIEAALAALRGGSPVVVLDAEDRENEGDLILAADKVMPEKIAFMVRHTSGLVCVALEGSRLDALDLPLMVPDNTEGQRTAFTVSVDARQATTTGISAADRARTIAALVDPATRPESLARPGHVFPLRARAGGVLVRPGHTEAAVDLAQLAGLTPAGVLAEVVNDDGGMARRPDLERFAALHGLVVISIAELILYRQAHERRVVRVASASLPTSHGEFDAHVYRATDDIEHLVLVRGAVDDHQPVLVRLHSECLIGDVIGSLRCDCGSQLDGALAHIAREGRGALVYLRGQEGRGIGLGQKLRAYALQDLGRDTVEANVELGVPIDAREYATAAAILRTLGVARVRLLTNNPAKVIGLEQAGLAVVERVPLLTSPRPENVRYLWAKQERLGHMLDLS